MRIMHVQSYNRVKKQAWKSAVVVAFALFVLRSAGCQFDLTGNPDTSLLTVHVSPDSAVVPLVQWEQAPLILTATITGFRTDGSVTWLIDGANQGTIVADGLTAKYYAEGIDLLHMPPYIRIKVIPTEDPSRYVVCNVRVIVPQNELPDDTSFVVSPLAVRLLSNHSQQFFLDTITFNGPISPVQWSMVAGPGSITSEGLYTSPETVADSTISIVRATSTTDTGVHSEATILLLNKTDSLLCYTRDVLPILSGSCGTSGCHDASNHAAGYNFNTYAGTLPSVGAKSARSTRLYNSITQFEASSRMPPPPSQALTQKQVHIIGRWIDEGALDCP